MAIFLLVCFCLFFLMMPLAWEYWADRRNHGGLGMLRRRRIRRHGIVAEATVLSASLLPVRGRFPGTVYSMIFEVRPPHSPPVRVRVTEVFTLMDDAHQYVRTGLRVMVHYDQATQSALVVRPDPKLQQREAEERRKAHEAYLLRGGNDPR